MLQETAPLFLRRRQSEQMRDTASGSPCLKQEPLLATVKRRKSNCDQHHRTQHHCTTASCKPPQRAREDGDVTGKPGWIAYRNGQSTAYRPYYAQQKTDQAGDDYVEMAPLSLSRSRDEGKCHGCRLTHQ